MAYAAAVVAAAEPGEESIFYSPHPPLTFSYVVVMAFKSRAPLFCGDTRGEESLLSGCFSMAVGLAVGLAVGSAASTVGPAVGAY